MSSHSMLKILFDLIISVLYWICLSIKRSLYSWTEKSDSWELISQVRTFQSMYVNRFFIQLYQHFIYFGMVAHYIILTWLQKSTKFYWKSKKWSQCKNVTRILATKATHYSTEYWWCLYLDLIQEAKKWKISVRGAIRLRPFGTSAEWSKACMLKRVKFYCPSSTYPAIVLLELYFIAKL